MKKHKSSLKNQKIFIMLCILLWITVIASFLGFVRFRGGLKPEATNDDKVFVNAGFKLVSPEGISIKQGKVTLSLGGENHYFYADSLGSVEMHLAAGSYEITAEAPGYSTYQSTLDVNNTVRTHTITLHKKP